MIASKNLLKPADGEPIISPSKDMVLGVYYLTKLDTRQHRGDNRIFLDEGFKPGSTAWVEEKTVRLKGPDAQLVTWLYGRIQSYQEELEKYRGNQQYSEFLMSRIEDYEGRIRDIYLSHIRED